MFILAIFRQVVIIRFNIFFDWPIAKRSSHPNLATVEFSEFLARGSIRINYFYTSRTHTPCHKVFPERCGAEKWVGYLFYVIVLVY